MRRREEGLLPHCSYTAEHPQFISIASYESTTNILFSLQFFQLLLEMAETYSGLQNNDFGGTFHSQGGVNLLGNNIDIGGGNVYFGTSHSCMSNHQPPLFHSLTY
jgi:hypothetical protein